MAEDGRLIREVHKVHKVYKDLKTEIKALRGYDLQIRIMYN
jgi:hypothetical protein